MFFQLNKCYRCKKKFSKIPDSNEWECKKCELVVYNKYEYFQISYKKYIISYGAFKNTGFKIYIHDSTTFKNHTVFEQNYTFDELLNLKFEFIESIIATSADNLIFL